MAKVLKIKKLIAYLYCIVLNHIKSDVPHLADITGIKESVLMSRSIPITRFLEQFENKDGKVMYDPLIIKVKLYNK